MKSLFNSWKGRNRLDVETELRAARPEAPERLVRSIADTITTRPLRSRSRRSLGFVGALGVASLALLGATGGFSYAASSVASVVHATVHTAHVSASHSNSPAAANRSSNANSALISAACVQYGHAPTITKFAPATAVSGSKTVVTITGTNLQSADHDATVTAAGQPATVKTAATTGKTLGFTVDLSDHGSIGPVSVTTCSGTATSGADFTLVSKPTVTDFANNAGSGDVHALRPGQIVTITGKGFIGVAKGGVKFGTKPSTDAVVDSDTQITVTVPAGLKPGNLTVTNGGGTGTGPAFTFSADSPTVSSVTPPFAVAESQTATATPITVKGTNFDLTDEVIIGGSDADIVSVSTDKKTMVVTAASDANTGPSKVQVIDSLGGSATSAGSVTIEENPAPSAGGPFIIADHSLFGAKKGGTITITGTHLSGAKTVTFQGASKNTATATKVTDTSFSVVVPTGATNGQISVSNLAGSGNLNTGFTLLTAKPAPTGSTGTPSRGSTITITGSGFLGTTSVKVGAAAAVFSITDDGDLSVTIPAGAKTGLQTITIVNPVGSGTIKLTIS